MKISKHKLIKDIKEVSNILSKPPTIPEYKKLGKYSVQTVTRNFGSWNNALQTILGKANVIRNKNIKTKCAYCHCPMIIHKSEEKKNNFCSQSHAAKFNNSHRPKRKLVKRCSCGNLIVSNRKFCKICIKKGKHLRSGVHVSERTIEEVIKNKGPNRYGLIRHHARKITQNRKQICQKCGYSLHVDTCHIKEIKDFPLNTKISVVNHIDNLILLCKNCHWEMDHNYL